MEMNFSYAISNMISFKRLQFPIQRSFATSIDKSEVQILSIEILPLEALFLMDSYT